ncbi:Bacterial alpha-L-rhamnosidase [Anaerohalosphaera lusitana]|uniref:Bacterial alpha-L-rhamnosidase n=1 Tax=Anaerohalosphaera lusitana TaxID=1936003 RepID=A0A1U9NP33_9BACT|nr:family 78 glycoside hydrolase catalytic domain [Anaerohalosphaera lusitana]AQT69557.1 Bacterial alpha-L-rhamnosidase [Anaerohalosphaera lusitana]
MRRYLVFFIMVVLFSQINTIADTHPGSPEPDFKAAKPVWPKGRSLEKNLFVGFRTVLEDIDSTETLILRISGSSAFRIMLDGRLVGYGPARGPHGYYRVDEWDIPADNEKAILAIEVAGYNVNSYYLLDQPAFLQAELLQDGKVIAATGSKDNGFETVILNERVQKVQRYSFQRPFIEYYRLTPGYRSWFTDPSFFRTAVDCEMLENRRLIPRRVGYPTFKHIAPVQTYSAGKILQNNEVEHPWRNRSLVNIGPKLKGYKLENLDLVLSDEVQQIKTESKDILQDDYSAVPDYLTKSDYRIYDFGTNLTGFIGLDVTCKKDARIILTFDEILSDKDVSFLRLSCVNAIGYELAPGSYKLLSFEPYTLQHLKVMVLEGECDISNVQLTEYAYPGTGRATFDCSDERLNKLFCAAKQTFRQNTLDTFMDCPSRERAGWLCDSFFTSRVALDMTGSAVVEKVFFENYLLPEKFEHLPDGMLPMCYPADHNDGVYIPNWAMWFVLQLQEYGNRSRDDKMLSDLEPRVMALLDFLSQYENSDGLLENLPSWVFIEWSAANRFVQDVNYPSNMLYAAVLEAASEMYDKPKLAKKAQSVRETILNQSFDGTFFVDNAERTDDGSLEVTENRTEVCQYFAFYFDVASPETHPDLWKKLVNDFGPQRSKTKAFPEIHPANAFVGNYLRMELLSERSLTKQLRSELTSYFLEMAETTGTLWENMSPAASCNHGFASHVAHCLYRDILGVRNVDIPSKTVTLRLQNMGLEFCTGQIPTPNGVISISWKEDASGGFSANIELPREYDLELDPRCSPEFRISCNGKPLLDR